MTGPHNEYNDFLNNTDKALRNISMYLIENYKGNYYHCRQEKDCEDRFLEKYYHLLVHIRLINMWNKIKRIIKSKIRVGDNTDEQDNDELLRNGENETMSSINRMYNITYNTPRN
ncbi:hypothetical protein POVCU2_0086580 [Plasmodium ovale curtisi]|uniref:PIR Superfamily Protein n=1 Tax=Plasmodium ovale curtisi TaxID=864141 RepID=A0A1A8WMU1_PLAOA|nr:hypothetical protein POVCU2_0086580 [Plasmodium ovale curtisi]SBT02291.1 hypothetical protein POVCU1_075200 [Plasmodium ovale curtisi]